MNRSKYFYSIYPLGGIAVESSFVQNFTMLNHFKIELFLARETGFFQKDINNRNIFPRCRKKTREKRIKFKIFQNIISETCLRGNNNFRKLFNFLKHLTRVVEEQSGRKNETWWIRLKRVKFKAFPFLNHDIQILHIKPYLPNNLINRVSKFYRRLIAKEKNIRNFNGSP